MRVLEIAKTQFRVADFISWQREGSLALSPYFQRRPVWKPGAKSFFVDTVLRGLPAPVIYIREKIDLDSQRTVREVVDGQQRLRTLFAFVDKNLLSDFDASRDRVVVKEVHNPEAAGKRFGELAAAIREKFLGYQFSTHILPINVEDREILQMFARLNSTGVKLNRQELRNAQFFGELKTLAYELALEQLDRWRKWAIVSEDQIARMREVELTSDLLINILDGLTGKTQSRIDRFYEKYEEELPNKGEARKRFREVMETIEKLLGSKLARTVYSSEVYFFTLFVFIYDRLYGLGSRVRPKSPKRLPASLAAQLLKVGERFRSEDVPRDVLDAVRRASADTGRRRKRLMYLASQCDGTSG